MRFVSIVALASPSGCVWRNHPGRADWRLSPAPLAEPTLREGGVLLQPDVFIDRLVELPARHWIAVGQSITNDRACLSVRQQACEHLSAILERRALGLSAWRLRDAVETAACLVRRTSPRSSRHEGTMLATAHAAAETAALALLARADLPAEILKLLLSPFARL